MSYIQRLRNIHRRAKQTVGVSESVSAVKHGHREAKKTAKYKEKRRGTLMKEKAIAQTFLRKSQKRIDKTDDKIARVKEFGIAAGRRGRIMRLLLCLRSPYSYSVKEHRLKVRKTFQEIDLKYFKERIGSLDGRISALDKEVRGIVKQLPEFEKELNEERTRRAKGLDWDGFLGKKEKEAKEKLPKKKGLTPEEVYWFNFYSYWTALAQESARIKQQIYFTVMPFQLVPVFSYGFVAAPVVVY